MNPSKLLKLLCLTAALLGFIVITAVFLKKPKKPEAPFAKAIETVQKISLEIAPRAIVLYKKETVWEVAASSGGARFSADPEKIKTLLKSLEAVRVEDVISHRGQSAAEYEINPGSATAITVHAANPTSVAGIFGKQAPDFSHFYFRFPDHTTIYLARGAIRGELGTPEVKFWLNPDLLNLAEDTVQTVRMEGPGFKTLLERSSNTWSVNGKKVDPTRVWGVIGQLAHLRAEDFSDPAQSSSPSAGTLTYAAIEIHTTEGKTHRVRIGKLEAATKRHPVMVDEGPALGWISENTFQMLLQKPTDFKSL